MIATMSRRRRSRTSIVPMFTVLLAACAVGGDFVAPAIASSRARVYVASRGCRGHAYRPRTVTLACADGNLYATEIAYSSSRPVRYGSRQALASAAIHENQCKPDCAAGHFVSAEGGLIFKRIVRCADRRFYYSRVEYQSSNGKGEADIQPFERCRVVSHT